MRLDNGLLDTVMDTDTNEFGYANVARNLYEWMQAEATRSCGGSSPAGTNVDYDIDVLTNQLGPHLHPDWLRQPRLTTANSTSAPTGSAIWPSATTLPGPHGHPQGRRLHPPRPQRLRQLPRHHANRTPGNPIMNPASRYPPALTAILAILPLTACGETHKGCGQGTVNNPDPRIRPLVRTARRQRGRPMLLRLRRRHDHATGDTSNSR